MPEAETGLERPRDRSAGHRVIVAGSRSNSCAGRNRRDCGCAMSCTPFRRRSSCRRQRRNAKAPPDRAKKSGNRCYRGVAWFRKPKAKSSIDRVGGRKFRNKANGEKAARSGSRADEETSMHPEDNGAIAATGPRSVIRYSRPTTPCPVCQRTRMKK